MSAERTAVDVLIPTCNRPYALAMTLTSLASQTVPDMRIHISDQSDREDAMDRPELHAILRRYVGVALCDVALDAHRAIDGIHHAGKFGQHAVAGRVHHPAAMADDLLQHRIAIGLEPGEGAWLVYGTDHERSASGRGRAER